MIRSEGKWKKSSHSDSKGACLEIKAHGVLLVRDSKAPNKGCVTCGVAAWTDFVESIKTCSLPFS
ncbi:DUF397 domain-containing protein [Streptomyces sp. AC495_CC817]|uniref:DUF397 domain-containing protein n=1 Tax=Streptomyces sp. AC495_CC817 TaxID=2823900 RepID=UPI001C256A31|nr:DUF397 domain-containing protein [Streptomyces sp. AC495_CC817]